MKIPFLFWAKIVFLDQTWNMTTLDLNFELYPNQKQIYLECKKRGSGGLSLPMGSGKTRIALALALSDSKPALVVCSKSEMTVWHEEMQNLLPKGSFVLLHSEMIKNVDSWHLDPKTRIVVTNIDTLTKYFQKYQLLPLITDHRRWCDFGNAIQYWSPAVKPLVSPSRASGPGWLYAQRWGYLIIDEAQNYTNIKTLGCRSLLALAAEHRWSLSGTLFNETKTQNILGYYCLIDEPYTPRSMPDTSAYVRGSQIRYNLRGDLILNRFRKCEYNGLKATMVYRAHNPNYKPPKVISEVVTNTLRPVEAKVYVHFRHFFLKVYQEMKRMLQQNRKVEARLLRGNLLALITYLRLTLVAPVLALETLTKNSLPTNQKSHLLDEKLRVLLLEVRNLILPKEEMAFLQSKPSSRLQEILNKIQLYPQRRLVIFMGFRNSLNLLKGYLQDRLILTLSATDSVLQRKAKIKQFEQSENGILLLTYKIGANGLNLQAGSVVFITEYWWNEGQVKQALARVNRMGQTAPQLDLIYFTSNTAIEKGLLEKSKDKAKVYQELLVGKQTSSVKKMDLDRIYDLINTEINSKLVRELYL